MAQVPVEPAYFRVTGDPTRPAVLLGSRCPSCGEAFYPRRLVCAACLHEGCEDVELSTTGRLWTWTYVHVPLFAKKDGSVDSYGVGQVDLPEGPRVQAILVGDPDDFRIGMELELDLETLRENKDGDDVVIYRFAPVGGEAELRRRAEGGGPPGRAEGPAAPGSAKPPLRGQGAPAEPLPPGPPAADPPAGAGPGRPS